MKVKTLMWLAITNLVFVAACTKVIETDHDTISDTGDVVITCDANEGNKGLLNYPGDVYVHLGLITNKSEHSNDWRYVKFRWGSREKEALATPVEKNKWSYEIKNIREFFKVADDEQIQSLNVLFRSGACIDIFCKVQRNADGTDIHLQVHNKSLK